MEIEEILQSGLFTVLAIIIITLLLCAFLVGFTQCLLNGWIVRIDSWQRAQKLWVLWYV